MLPEYSRTVNDFPARLKEWRESKGLSQEEAAKMFGAAQPSWSRWEAGEKPLEIVRVAILKEMSNREGK